MNSGKPHGHAPVSGPDHQIRLEFRRALLEGKPPLVRFTTEIREAIADRHQVLDHIESMMSLLEIHPLIPFEEYSFGSDLLNFRRALAYELVLRLLAHARSFVINVNIRNRAGAGVALRCMLDVHGLMTYLQSKNRLQDASLLEKFVTGQSFATGADFFLKQAWLKEKGTEMPADTKAFFEALLGIPRTGIITQAAHSADEGFSVLYARYSEYVHFAFAQPRMEIEEALGHTEETTFGSKEYFRSGQSDGAPVESLGTDIDTASITLELAWPLVLSIDPFLAKDTREQVIKTLKDQGLT